MPKDFGVLHVLVVLTVKTNAQGTDIAITENASVTLASRGTIALSL